MTLTVILPTELEQKVTAEAARQGIDAGEYTRRVLEEHLSESNPPDYATLELLAKWDDEDKTDDPAELERRRKDWEDLKQSLNENHSSNRQLFP
jgi:hypothetical protein